MWGNLRVIPKQKVGQPLLASRVKERHNLFRIGVNGSKVGPFMLVAKRTGKGQIIFLRDTTMLFLG